MRRDEENPLVKQMKEAVEKNPHIDMELIKKFQSTLKQIDSIPDLPSDHRPETEDKPSLQPIPLRFFRQ